MVILAVVTHIVRFSGYLSEVSNFKIQVGRRPLLHPIPTPMIKIYSDAHD